MTHANTIFVTSLFEMPHYVRQFAPTRLVSIIQPELQPERPPEMSATTHLRVGVHDITERQYDNDRLIGEADVRTLLDFIEAWEPADGCFLVHCYAGISRSTATALIASYVKTGDAERSALDLRAAAPHAAPNRLIIALADDLLGCRGQLIDAREMMGQYQPAVEAPLTTLRLPG